MSGDPGATRAAVPHWLSPDDRPIEIVDGDGARVTGADGTEYLDFVSQLFCVNAGHGNGTIVDAMADQLGRVQYVSSAKHNDARSRLAAALVEVAPGSLDATLFAVSGSEANEAAVQIAREYADANTVLTRWRSYHGWTYGAGSLTGDPDTRATIERHAATSGASKFLPPIPAAFDAEGPEDLAARAADHLEYVIKNEGPDDVAAVMMEPVAGASGAYTAPPGYFERVRGICDRHDVLLIADEVITGFGRCGEWFGVQTEGIEPDLLTFAKGVTSAYAPLAGVLASGAVGDHVREGGLATGQTFAGHPVACAAGLGALEEYRGGLIENVRERAPYLEECLREVGARHDAVAAVRGRGFLWALEFADPETGEPFHDPRVDDGDNPVDAVIAEAEDRGLLIVGGRPNIQIHAAPPFTVDAHDIDEAVEALDAAIDAAF